MMSNTVDIFRLLWYLRVAETNQEIYPVNIRSVLFLTCSAIVLPAVGCVSSTASTVPKSQTQGNVDGIAASPPPESVVSPRKLVKSVEEDGPQMAPEPLPSDAFRIDRRSNDKVPRVELTMINGPAQGGKFTCNLIVTGSYPSFTLASKCSGKEGPIDPACVNRGICFSAFECACEAKDTGLPEVPLQDTHN